METAADLDAAREVFAVAEPLDAGAAAPALTPPRTVVLQGRGPARDAPLPPPALAVQWIATGGLGLVVWLTLYLILSKTIVADQVATTSFATAVWLPCLEAARRAVPPSIGRSFAAVTGTVTGVVLGSAIQSWLHFLATPLAPPVLLLAASAVCAATMAWWLAVDHVVGAKQRVMVVGTSGSATEAAAALAAANSDLFEIVGAVDADADGSPDAPDELSSLSGFTEVLRAQHPDVLVVADEHSCGRVIGPLLDLGAASPRVVGLTGFFEHALGRVPVDRLGTAWFMALLHLKQRPHSRCAKRLFDLVGAALGLLVLAPLLALVALLIRRTEGPVIYRQTRVGQGGAPFEIYKFRTMRVDAEGSGCCRWASADDPRVTGIGRMLRRTHLDELPQLWNVVRGEMSLVGPRPERPEFVEQLEDAVPFWGRRLLIKPGLTGWAQLHNGYAADVDSAAAKLSYDLWYLRHRSVVLDLAICVKTLSSAFGVARGR
jgi:exopolysaccharide biosynthesis polyprenyl glycosylphosphotransferase